MQLIKETFRGKLGSRNFAAPTKKRKSKKQKETKPVALTFENKVLKSVEKTLRQHKKKNVLNANMWV